jgi:hypothetical protein
LENARRAYLAYLSYFAIFFGEESANATGKNTNGDSLCSLSSSPSPERIDESVLENRRLKRAYFFYRKTP